MKRTWCVFCLLSCLAIAGSAKAADEGKLEIAGGYSVLHVEAASSNFQGGALDVAIAATPWLAVVGEIGTDGTKANMLADISLHVHAFLAGPRYLVHARENVAVFGQVLFGDAMSNAILDGVESSRSDLAIQPGGGIDIDVGPKWAVRFEGDYRAVRANAATTKQERFLVGLVFHP
ncbi:MAG TPA: outer membrane beta-barrel protein [Vicinamibacterales bacterium]|nr:outer membrane beta-barrel protein [Vicinamibacterales bacterium]